MAGTLEVTDELCWMPAGWVFDAILARLAAELAPQDPVLAARLLAARTDANGGYLDLRTLDRETWRHLSTAAERVAAHLQGEAPQGEMPPDWQAGLLAQCRHLRDLVQAGWMACVAKGASHATPF